MITAISIFFFARDQDKLYSSDTVLYTGIATGSRIANGEKEAPKAADNAYGNMLSLMNSREIKEEVITRLIASHLMLPGPDPSVVSEKTYERLHEVIPASLKKKLVGKTMEETTRNIRKYYTADTSNPIYNLINSGDPVYSTDAFEEMMTERMGASDLIKVSYTSNDPATTFHTLENLINVFTRKHEELFMGQNKSVMGYFDSSTEEAYEKLKSAQEKLLAFQRANNIVDYDQQIASSSAVKTQAEEQYKEVEMLYIGALTALKAAENKLSGRGASNLKSQEIIRLRNELSELNTQIMELELQRSPQPDNNERLTRLKQEAQTVSDKIADNVAAYEGNNTAEGVPITGVLNTYVQNTILVEELKSKLDVLRRQRDASSGEYEELAPLGSQFNNLKRDVEVAEQEYTAQLEGLKQSKLNQQNIAMASNLKVIDPPYFPIKSTGASLIMLVLFGFFGAFLLTSAGVFAADKLDNSLRKPELALKTINFPILGVLPETTGKPSAKQLDEVKRAEDQLARQVLLKLQQQRNPNSPRVIGVLSSYSGEGKTTVANALANSLHNMGIEVVSFIPDGHAFPDALFDTTTYYSPVNGVRSDSALSEMSGRSLNSTDVVIIEFPPLLESVYPVLLLERLDMILVTVQTNRTWEQADKTVFENIEKITNAPIEVVLNGVLQQYVQDYVGAPAKSLPAPTRPAPTEDAHQKLGKWEKETPILNP
ncbi:GumC family protein [Pontibacter akesuensis]|uniref:GumC family protein n=1 Tax=Pontibacter akesuensis TaxID=388950 RepID=UPI00083A8DD7|nr:hypothetical protein [Pontibacter akesuensis]